MDTKGLQKEFLSWCKSKNKSPKTEDETKLLFVAFMKEKHPEEYKQAVLNQLKAQAQKAAHGAKLNYFKSLKNQCAEDEEVVYYKKGGSVGCGCKKKDNGGPITKDNPSWKTNFENRNKKQEDPNANTTWDPKLRKRRKMTPEEIAKAAKNRADARQGKGEGTPQRKCGGKVKKNEDGSKINKNCGGAVAKFKMHRLGGSLNPVPFMLLGTNKGGAKKRIWRFEKPYIYDNSEFLDVQSDPDKYGRFINISRMVTPKYDGTFDNDTSYTTFVHNPYNVDLNVEYDSRNPGHTNPEYKSPKQVLKNKFNTWGEYFKYLLSLKNK